MKSEFLSNFFTIFPNELSLELFPIFTDCLITKNISEEFAIGTTIYNRVCKKSIELRKKVGCELLLPHTLFCIEV